MKNLTEILLEIDRQEFSGIAEVETQYDLDQAQLKKAIKDQATHLSENYDLKSGQSVLIKNGNNIKFFVDFLALYFMEITAVPVDPQITPAEYQNLVSSLRPKLVLTNDEILVLDGVSRDDFSGIALILFTSGTTSLPKGVMISKESLQIKMKLFERVIGNENIERSLCFVPTFFGHGLICNSLYPIFHGKKFFISKGMSIGLAEKFSGFLLRERITFFSSVPSHWEFILNFAGDAKNHSLKRVHSASAPLRGEKAQMIRQWLGADVELYDIYGATEMLGWFAGRKIAVDGRENVFEDFWDAEKKINEQGEMILKSAYMAKGYWLDETILPLHEFNTGDVFQGSSLKGRTKNVVNKNGIKVQIEDIVFDAMKSGLLLDAAAFPIPDEYTGERIGLFVRIKPGSSLADFLTYCRESISPLKVPSEIIPVEKIPVNKRGKSSSAELQKVFTDLSVIDQDALTLFNRIFKANFKSIDISRDDVANWDSMRHAELIINMQKQFAVKFSASDLIKTNNLKELVILIKKAKLG